MTCSLGDAWREVESMAELQEIRIVGVRLNCRIGVPFRERRRPQTLELDLVLRGPWGSAALQDDLAETVDYGAVVHGTRAWAGQRSFQLLETFAERLALMLLDAHPSVAELEVVVRKYILPGVHHVEYRLKRTRTKRID
ncbi:MAG: dihydroneopterin aldolase [Verrucomicrobiota bacterium]|nr:dihydroneopterin aldolase [Verrucomicrobiota bacterium]